MKINFLKLLLCAFVALSFAGRAAQADEATLAVGSDAPALSVASWWQDKALAPMEKGKVYVVDFWASWCGPCRASMPHLFELQKKYADQGVEFAGISIDRNTAAADKYLTTLGTDLPVHFGLDDAGKNWAAWGTAAGRNSIPSTYLVGKDGKIAWIGHPMKLEPELEKALAQ